MRNESFSSEMNAPLNGNIFWQNVINLIHTARDTRRDTRREKGSRERAQ